MLQEQCPKEVSGNVDMAINLNLDQVLQSYIILI